MSNKSVLKNNFNKKHKHNTIYKGENMSRYDILCGRPVKGPIKEIKTNKYFYGIDLGIREGTAIAVCHRDEADNIGFDYVEKSQKNLNDWLIELNDKCQKSL
jgi:hypothetical protein